MGFMTKKSHFCVHFAWTMTITIFHQQYTIPLKLYPKNKFLDPEFVTADNKNAIETPFLSPQKGMGGNRFIGKVKLFGLNWTNEKCWNCHFCSEGALKAPPSTCRGNLIFLWLMQFVGFPWNLTLISGYQIDTSKTTQK